MTDKEKIERLAKWMGWKLIKHPADDEHPRGYVELGGFNEKRIWNPLYDLNDAWMLVKRAQESMPPEAFDRFMEAVIKDKESVLQYTKKETACAICEVVLEAIE